MAGGKAGAAGAGVLAVLGLGLARGADDCARAGVRGGRAMGEVGEGAVRGGRAVWGAEDAVRSGARVGAELPGRAMAGRALRESPGSGSSLDEVLGELAGDGIELGLQTIDLDDDDDDDAPVAAVPRSTACPRLVDATVSAADWTELLGGFGIACAPVIVVGRAGDEPDQLRLGGKTTAVADLAVACRQAEGHCLFVACDAADPLPCARATMGAHRRATLDEDLAVYQNDVALHLLSQDPAPAWVAVMSAANPPQLRIARLDETN